MREYLWKATQAVKRTSVFLANYWTAGNKEHCIPDACMVLIVHGWSRFRLALGAHGTYNDSVVVENGGISANIWYDHRDASR
jgi:hypothetical protein